MCPDAAFIVDVQWMSMLVITLADFV